MNAHTPAPLWAAARRPARCDRNSRPGFTTRAGFTLLEMLVALAITMLMMGAAVTLFQRITDSVSGSRAIIEVAERLRATRNRLQADLVGATATMAPPLRPESDEGYFEYIEGPATDFRNVLLLDPSMSINNSTAVSLFGDTDDVLMFTVRSRAEPFVGKYYNSTTLDPTQRQTTVESQEAEVIYFLAQTGNEPVLDATTVDSSGNPDPVRLYTLYRRVLLVAPSLPTFTGTDSNGINNVVAVYDRNDVSVRFQLSSSASSAIPNSLGDLTKRENRFAHYGTTFATFPFSVMSQQQPSLSMPNNNWSTAITAVTNGIFPLGPTTSSLANHDNAYLAPMVNSTTNSSPYPRAGDDVLMTNVLAFDVQAWDPGAPVFNSAAAGNPSVAIEPRDRGYRNALTTWINNSYSTPSTSDASPPISFGAYADLAYGIFPTGGLPAPIVYGATWPPNASWTTAPRPVLALLPTTSATGTPIIVTPNSGWSNALTLSPYSYDNNNRSYYLYDTWSMHYENDGLAQTGTCTDSSGNPIFDAGTNGIDDNGNGVVDDQLEYDTLPPYQAPLRGIRVVIRVYEPSSQQVREVTVVQDFLAD